MNSKLTAILTPSPNRSCIVHTPVGPYITIITDKYIRQKSRKTLSINYGISPTPFGDTLLSWCHRGICSLTFCPANPETQLRELIAKWPAATFNHKPDPATGLVKKIFHPDSHKLSITLLLQGTDFQKKVWRALLNTRPGQTISYSRLAQMAGAPKAQRAVGSALAVNPISYLIPCHRVIKKNGTLGNYRWGSQRKQKILDWESANKYP